MFRGSVKGTGYPLHSPVSPSLSLPSVAVCHHISTGLYQSIRWYVDYAVHCLELRWSTGSGMFGSGSRLLIITPWYENWHPFRNTNIKIEFRTNNTCITFYIPDTITPIYTHKVAFISWNATLKLSYMGQTGCRLDLRFKDHSHYATLNNPQSAHAIPNIHSTHVYGPNGNHYDLITFRIEM